MADKYTFSADGQSDTVNWLGGKGCFVCYGTWGGGTATLQFSVDSGTTWLDAGTDTTITANGGGIFELPVCQLRVDLASSTTPSLTSDISQTAPPLTR